MNSSGRSKILSTEIHPDIRSVMLIAGEESGDRLGAELTLAWKELERESNLRRPTEFFGAGGPQMRAAGVELAEELTQHAVVGLIEVLKHYGTFKSIFEWLLELAFVKKPEVVILIDYPGFNLRFVKELRRRIRKIKKIDPQIKWNPKLVFYVSPQLWAWKASRAVQMEKDLDLVLSIFPFEKEWYASRAPQLKVEFVGHPIVDRFAGVKLDSDLADPTQAAKNHPKILLLPGSRKREIQAHTLPLALTAKTLARKYPEAEFIWIFPSQERRDQALKIMNAENLETSTDSRPDNPFHYQIGNLYTSLKTASFAIASSGTVTLECAYFRVPTIVVYRAHPLTFYIGKKLVQTPFLAMPNILCGREIFPEYLQDDLTPEALTQQAISWLDSDEELPEIRRQLEDLVASLGDTGASYRAVYKIWKTFSDSPKSPAKD